MDDVLVPLGHRQLAQGWRSALRRWLVDSEALTLTVRKGRRIGASTIIAPRLIAAWIIVVLPRLRLPPGEKIMVALVSVRKGEAANRIGQISAVLGALGIAHEAKSESIDVTGAPVTIKVLARNWKSVVGENIGLLWCDEVSRWDSDEVSANPADEVISSLKPALGTLAAVGLALMVLASSPWSLDDYHAQQYDKGDTADQRTAFIPTWEGNPTLTEEMTHQLEPDERKWRREYAAIPGSTVSGALDPDDAAAAFGMVLPTGSNRDWCVIDASSLRGDCFAYMIGHESRGGFVVDKIHGWEDSELQDVTLDQIVTIVAADCRARGIRCVYGDQRESAGLESLFSAERIAFTSIAWTAPSKHSAFLALRRLLRDRHVQLPEHPQLRRQMRACRARLLPSGITTYETNGLDYLSCLVTLIHAYEKEWPQDLARLMAPDPVWSVSPEEKQAAEAKKLKDQARKISEKLARKRVNLW